MKNIVDIVEREARKNGATKVQTIRIRVGEFRGIVEEQLLFSFGFLRKGTLAEEATLEVEKVPIRSSCRSCEQVFVVEDYQMICPRCNSGDVSLLTGMELEVREIEIE